MLRRAGRWVLCLALPLWLGCAMCANTDDYSYSAYGGRWQRDDPVEGRVGSIFAPAGGMVITDEIATSESSDAAQAGVPEEGTSGDSEVDLLETGHGGAVKMEPNGHESASVDSARESLMDVSGPTNSASDQEPTERSVQQ